MKPKGAVRAVGIVAAMHKTNIEDALRSLLAALDRHGISVLLASECAELLGRRSCSAHQDDIASSDLIFALGGDGCILSAVRMAAKYGTPILGVRVGGLGFLSEVDWQDLEGALEAILSGRYLIESRTLFQAAVHREDEPVWLNYGLNDVVVLRVALSQVQMFEVRINGELLMAEFADGVIVATPTGSTAYSLSAGGPIVTPDADVFIITPVCAHSLHVRTVVTSQSAELSIKVTPTKAMPVDAAVMVDGQLTLKLLKDDVVYVRASDYKANLVRLHKFNFLERLREKLKWGYRNEPLLKQHGGVA
ncbi:MAG: NAD(+)/NADH kinase [Armatimonadota bacterium]|nr:NAD(+)/NADH kinase [Armatimonadota bacterium]MCX7776860.1 NAD(+)/NADH kinase [Armatimonadota bacterium]MDW8024454.1 NAD(+)/NADH kinase [Armatimonadota bacterium]